MILISIRYAQINFFWWENDKLKSPYLHDPSALHPVLFGEHYD